MLRSRHKYLVKTVLEHTFADVNGQTAVSLESRGLVSSFMFQLQRNDVNLRNDWSNYTNWPYRTMPSGIEPAPIDGLFENPGGVPATIGPGVNVDDIPTGLSITGDYTPLNIRDILVDMGIKIDNEYRENTQPAGAYALVQKYLRSPGAPPTDIYCYNFCLNTTPGDLNTSGTQNMNVHKKFTFEFKTIVPPADPLAQTLSVCDPDTGAVIGVNKSTWQIYDYTYTMTIFEERVNFVEVSNDGCNLTFAI